MEIELSDSMKELLEDVSDVLLVRRLQDYHYTTKMQVAKGPDSYGVQSDYLDNLRMLDSIEHVLSHFMSHTNYKQWKVEE